MASKHQKFQCPYCEAKLIRPELIEHIEKNHQEELPEGYSATRVVYHIVNNMTERHCRVCGRPTSWNEKTGKYNQLCDDPKCKEKLCQLYRDRAVKARGTYEFYNDPEHQKKMLKGRKISGTYIFTDSGKIDYVGQYERKCLEFMDKVMMIPSKDIATPGPTIKYQYNGEEHFYIPDIYYIPFNLIIEIKDGGQHPNMQQSPSRTVSREKTVAKEKVITDQGEFNYVRLTDNNFAQLIEIFMELKEESMNGQFENKRVVRVHESENMYNINELFGHNKYNIASDPKFDEILKFNDMLKSWSYGLMYKGKIIPDTPENFYKYYTVQSSQEFEKNKCGVCWDYVIYQAHWFKSHGIKYMTYFLVSDKGETHTFTTFEYNRVYFWFEASYKRFAGIRGFKKETYAWQAAVWCSVRDWDSADRVYLQPYSATDPKYVGMSCKEFMDSFNNLTDVTNIAKLSDYRGQVVLYSNQNLYISEQTLVTEFTVVKENMYTDNYYRVTYNGIGIYEAFKVAAGPGVWLNCKSSPAFTWLPLPPNYAGNYYSYFTEDGYLTFKRKTLPVMVKYLDPKKINVVRYTGMNNRVVYKDKYQVIVEQNPDTLSENTLIIDDCDVYYNKAEFRTGQVNICFTTGETGPGVKEYLDALKDLDIEVYKMDYILQNYLYSDEEIKSFGKLGYSFFKTYPRYRIPYRSNVFTRDQYIKTNSATENEYYYDNMAVDFVKYAIAYAKSHIKDKFYIDGIWMVMFRLEPETFDDCAFFIEGMSMRVKYNRVGKRNVSLQDNVLDKLQAATFGSVHDQKVLFEKRLRIYTAHFRKISKVEIMESVEQNHDTLNEETMFGVNSLRGNHLFYKIPNVYFTRIISPYTVVRLYKMLNHKLPGKVAVKLHSGEAGNKNFLGPDFWGELIRYVDGTVVECNTAYEGQRNTTKKHIKVLKDHKWSEYFDVDIMDAEGDDYLPVYGGNILEVNAVGKHIHDYDSMLVLSHFKGHAMGGYGGALKNISIGVASAAGKKQIHRIPSSEMVGFGTKVDQNEFLMAMADAAKSVVDYFDGNMVFINAMVNISVDCDCAADAHPPCMKDIGLLISDDPVAIDQACIDLIYKSDDKGRDTLLQRIKSKQGEDTIKYANDIGVGSYAYNFIDLDQLETMREGGMANHSYKNHDNSPFPAKPGTIHNDILMRNDEINDISELVIEDEDFTYKQEY